MVMTSSARLVSRVATTSPGATPWPASSGCGGFDAAEELAVGEGGAVVVDARAIRIGGDPAIG